MIEAFDDLFLVKNKRKSLIEYLEKHGRSKKEIDDFIKKCDKMYEEEQIPYPNVDDL